MNNADMPAIPSMERLSQDYIQQAKAVGIKISSMQNHKGLTKREAFAMAAMQGILTAYDMCEDIADSDPNTTAELAINHADSLLKALEKDNG